MKHSVLLLVASWIVLSRASFPPPPTEWRTKELPYDSYYLQAKDRLPTKICDIRVEEGDLVTFWSSGFLINNQNFDKGEYEIKIGNKEAIKGVDLGVRGMCPGDVRRLYIQPSWGYGRFGLDVRVPYPWAFLTYDITLLKIQRENQKREGLLMDKFLTTYDQNTVENCGLKVKIGDKVKVYIKGSLTNGNVWYKDNRRRRPLSLTIDSRKVIYGLDKGIRGMCVGGKRKMAVHHSYAYGPMGHDELMIPPYANLVLEVELVRIERPGVGWENLDLKRRTTAADITSLNPMKITDLQETGACDAIISESSVVRRNTFGYLLNGTIFLEEKEAENTIGDGKTLRGIEDGLLGLCAGDKRSLILHSDMAYGKSGIPGRVPMSATVIIDIVVLDVKNAWKQEDEVVERYRKYAEVAPAHHDDGHEFHSHSHHVVA